MPNRVMPQPIDVTVVDVETGRKRYGWNRSELKRNLQIPESTLKRYLVLLAVHATAEFGYVSRQRSFTHYQIHALKTLREWFTYLSQAEVIKRLQEEGLPDDQQETA
jgi:DNA-binding IclR family transcriptional regulator